MSWYCRLCGLQLHCKLDKKGDQKQAWKWWVMKPDKFGSDKNFDTLLTKSPLVMDLKRQPHLWRENPNQLLKSNAYKVELLAKTKLVPNHTQCGHFATRTLKFYFILPVFQEKQLERPQIHFPIPMTPCRYCPHLHCSHDHYHCHQLPSHTLCCIVSIYQGSPFEAILERLQYFPLIVNKG